MEQLSEREIIERFGVEFYREILKRLYTTILETKAFKDGDRIVIANAVFSVSVNNNNKFIYCVAHTERHIDSDSLSFKMDNFIISTNETDLIDCLLDFSNRAKCVGMKTDYSNN